MDAAVEAKARRFPGRDTADGDGVSGPHRPRVLGLEGLATAVIEPPALRERLVDTGTVVIDLDTSRRYAQGHIPGAWFTMRSYLADVVAKLPNAPTIVLTSPDDQLARLAAAEIGPAAGVPVMVLAGGTEAWRLAGLPVETGASHMASEANDVVLSARERGQGREEAMREYLAWEINLVHDMASDDDQRFRVIA